MKRSNDAFLQRLRQVPVPDVCISIITKSELLYGIEMSPRRRQHEVALRGFLRQVEVLDFPDKACSRYTKIRADLKMLGTMIGANDLCLLEPPLHSAGELCDSTREFLLTVSRGAPEF